MERLLPKKMIPVFLEEAQIPEDKKIRDISKKERRHMIELMKNFEMHITGAVSYTHLDMQTIRYLLYIFQTVTKVSPELLPEE